MILMCKYFSTTLLIFIISNFVSGQSNLSNQSNATITPNPTSTVSNKNVISSDCVLSKSSEFEKELLKKVEKLKGEKYEWEDEEHKYFFSICSKADNGEEDDQGFVQMNKKEGKKFVLGRLNDVDLEGLGSKNIIRLQYKNGDKYNNACNKAERSTAVYLVCDPNLAVSKFNMVEENNQRGENCDYVFELFTSKICEPSASTNNQTTTSATTTATSAASNASSTTSENKKASKALGFFSIILIVFASVLFLYFLIGTLYMRYVKQATGLEQIPNFGFWSSIGNSLADGCNYVCRCGSRTTEIHTYENINDRLSDDENLLNM